MSNRLNAGRVLQIALVGAWTLAFPLRDASAQWDAARALPGTLEAEDFSHGVSGFAYLDRDGGNVGGEYRPTTDVDIETCSEGGFNVGWVYPGEWLRYNVSAARAGLYTLEFRVAAPGAGGTFHLEIDGTNATGPLTIPDTGDWQTWTTVRTSGVYLPSGTQAWRLVIDSVGAGGYVGNFNYIRASGPEATPAASTPYGRTPMPLPGRIEAEFFDNGGEGAAYHDLSPVNEGGEFRPTGVDVELSRDGGYNVGYAFAGEWLAYTVSVDSSGSYDLVFRVASGGEGGTFHLEVDGVDRTGPMTIPDTGAWQNWVTIRRIGVSLTAGQRILRLVMDTNGPTTAVGNFNWLGATPSTPAGRSTPFGGFAVTVPNRIDLEKFDDGGEGIAYHDLTPGNAGGWYRATDVDIDNFSDAGDEPIATYSVASTAGEWLNYTVNVEAAGVYAIDLRVRTNGGGTFHIEVDGVDMTGPLMVPNSSPTPGDINNFNWGYVSTRITVNAGVQVWRLVMDTNGPNGHVGYFNHFYARPVSSFPRQYVNVALPGTIEAENFDTGGEGAAYHDSSAGNAGGAYRETDVDVEPTPDTPDGFNVGWMFAGEWLIYTVDVTASGTYDIEVRVASNGPGGTFHITLDGFGTTTGTFTVPDTGGWQSWSTLRKTGLTLTGGLKQLRLVMDTNGATGAVGNIDYIRVIRR
jgi:hypothetical protein